MLINSTGRRILFERPRMTLVTLNPKFLHTLPDYTLGNIYIKWMDTYGFVPGLRSCVRYINHEEWAYVMQRYRESHDFYHILMGLPATIEGEILLKWFEWINMGLPIAILSAIFGSFSLFLKKKCKNISYPLIKWAIQNGQQARESMINIYWEEELKTDINILRKRIGIIPYDLKESK
ncbi:hypothetical protein PNEG_00860 [Pneumocystis murina B123]|uniref:4-hydroxy-3-methoxy-5-polyprenylbenzoate decarboxylase n=1 Tax=Pneumocystis murina (strain B123) TaxID=1069680 RepID=M7PA23_PNEMU|nr:hypothetical protein PNEG_00860 [Pneumocystis murina B123]EMR10710.1 hypothetical protein PNEG_00860 [Pneumocystis murina B123]